MASSARPDEATSQRRVILASGSRQRRAALETLPIDFEVIPSDFPEETLQDDDMARRAHRLAHAKASTVAVDHPEAIIIAGDTFIELGERMIEKPADEQEAIEMLQLLSSETFHVHTGYCYLDAVQAIEVTATVTIQSQLRQLSRREIERFVADEPVTEWSGGFAPAYLSSMSLVAEMGGSFTGFTHGLPLERIVPLLHRSAVL
jgi:septum formation protein